MGVRKPLTIKPLRVAPALPPLYEKEAWQKLSTAVQAVFAKEPVPKGLSLEELYQVRMRKGTARAQAAAGLRAA